MKHIVIALTSIFALLLAACGGQSATTPTLAPTQPSEQSNQTAPTPTAEEIASGGQTTSGGNESATGTTFSIDVTGDFAQTLTDAANTIKLTYRDVGGYAYFLEVGDEFGVPILMIMFAGKEAPKAGTYTLKTTDSAFYEDGDVTANGSFVSDERDANGLVVVYSFNQSAGTITLEENGGVYSGSLDFTMQGKAFNSNEYTKTVTVKGTFSGLETDAG